MTLVARELVESQRLEGTVPRLTTGLRRWKCFDDSGATIEPGLAVSIITLPVRGSQDFPGVPAQTANAFRVFRADQDTRYCLVEWEYIHEDLFAESPLPGEPGFVKFETETRSEVEELWRFVPTVFPRREIGRASCRERV